jgi:hypothetical protein
MRLTVALWQHDERLKEGIRMSVSKSPLRHFFLPPSVPQTHPRASAIFINEFDAGGFQSATNG